MKKEDIKRSCDVVIVGSGVAGLYTALNLNTELSCIMITKSEIESSNSWLAQGGIAAVTKDDDDFALHFNDTMRAGAGMCDEDAVNVLVTEGPLEIQHLIEMDVPFDCDDEGELRATMEGGHSKRRVLHCGGDASGKETVKALEIKAKESDNITILENTCLVDIIVDKGKAVGVVIFDGQNLSSIATKKVVISTGGAGQIFKNTTNPVGATGDGIAAAIRVGAAVKDMEFIQFHPTAMYGDPDAEQYFLISEAVRGEGAILRNNKGEAFMEGKHERKDLAPRDIVARAIVAEMGKTGSEYVFLDASHMSSEAFEKRFPTIFHQCKKDGVNLTKDMIKVCPVQHYLMGGLETDVDARTNIQNLYACGEASRTGVHGGNRLASNSLLECLVFGKKCADQINATIPQDALRESKVSVPAFQGKKISSQRVLALRKQLKATMTEDCGVVRNQQDLDRGIAIVEKIYKEIQEAKRESQSAFELLNMATVAREMLAAAKARKTSIGAHYRSDAPA